jgi:TRAP-type C4-dicarboxylate transport system permease small subunit
MHAMAFLRRLSMGLAIIGCLLACLTAIMTTVSILGRALWATPIQGDVELTQFGIAVSIALCLPWCQFRRANIIVDFFTAGAAPAVRRRLDAIGAVLLASMMALLAWRTAAGAMSASESGETTIILGLPMWLVYATLAPALAITAVVALCQAVLPNDLAGSPEPHP